MKIDTRLYRDVSAFPAVEDGACKALLRATTPSPRLYFFRSVLLFSWTRCFLVVL